MIKKNSKQKIDANKTLGKFNVIYMVPFIDVLSTLNHSISNSIFHKINCEYTWISRLYLYIRTLLTCYKQNGV